MITKQKEADGTWTVLENEEKGKVEIGQIPVMVKSTYCSLNESDTSLTEVGECEFDQGGYFIVKGTEKVIVASERMASNFVYVFEKASSTKYCWSAEIRSQVDTRPPQQFTVSLTKAGNKRARGGILSKVTKGQSIYATLPYINADIPLAILFRALNCISDQEIVEKICFD